MPLPDSGSTFTEVQRAIRNGNDVLAAGMSGDDFKIWSRHDNAWSVAGSTRGAPEGVRDLAVTNGQSVIATESLLIAGTHRRTPAPPIAVAARGDTLLMATADSLWQTTVHP